MQLEGKRIGFVFTGSFCTFRKTIEELKKIVKAKAKVIPIMSEHSYTMDTKFGNAIDFINEIENITNEKILHTIQDVEPLGPKDMLDILVVAPASGNTMAKLANDIIDGTATMAVKSHLRRERPVVIGISTNNGLSGAGENIGKLLNRKHYYFIPFRQDNPITKPRSLVFDPTYLSKTIEELKKIVKEKAKVIPIMSEHSYTMDTKFGNAIDFINEIENITNEKILHTIQDVEPLGPKDMLDILVVAPASGNTMAKLANDIIDGTATMAVKSHLRRERPVVIGISTNNGLSGAGENIGKLLNRKHFYFVPFRQDNPITKPRSIVFDPTYLSKTIEYALNNEQIQPIIL